MRTLTFPLLIMLLAGCAKDVTEIAQDLGLLPPGCGTAEAHMQATVGDASFCATLQLSAVGDGSSVIVTGVDMAGTTLMLQVDDPAPGVHPITEAANAVLCLQAGATFTVAPGTEGQLTVLAHDTAAHRFTGNFTVLLTNEQDGGTRALSGDVAVQYAAGG